MTEIKDLTFRQRVMRMKVETFDLVVNSEKTPIENSQSGHYNLKSINLNMNKSLLKYELDLECVFYPERVDVVVTDCLDDDKKIVLPVDFSDVQNIGKLQLMKNLVMSDGAKKTFLRRYALTIYFNLPSSDKMDDKNDFRQREQQQQQNTPVTPPKPKTTIDSEQIAQLRSIMKDQNIPSDAIKDFMKSYNYKSWADIEIKNYNLILSEFKRGLKLTSGQIKLIHVLLSKNKNNINDDKYRKYLKDNFNVDSSKDLYTFQFNQLQNWLTGQEEKTNV